MVSQFFVCHLCQKPVEIVASSTDENGRAVHEECYVKAIRKPSQPESGGGPKSLATSGRLGNSDNGRPS